MKLLLFIIILNTIALNTALSQLNSEIFTSGNLIFANIGNGYNEIGGKGITLGLSGLIPYDKKRAEVGVTCKTEFSHSKRKPENYISSGKVKTRYHEYSYVALIPEFFLNRKVFTTKKDWIGRLKFGVALSINLKSENKRFDYETGEYIPPKAYTKYVYTPTKIYAHPAITYDDLKDRSGYKHLRVNGEFQLSKRSNTKRELTSFIGIEFMFNNWAFSQVSIGIKYRMRDLKSLEK